MFYIFYLTASATAYGQKRKVVVAEHSATAEGENCTYGPTLSKMKANFWQPGITPISKIQ